MNTLAQSDKLSVYISLEICLFLAKDNCNINCFNTVMLEDPLHINTFWSKAEHMVGSVLYSRWMEPEYSSGLDEPISGSDVTKCFCIDCVQ